MRGREAASLEEKRVPAQGGGPALDYSPWKSLAVNIVGCRNLTSALRPGITRDVSAGHGTLKDYEEPQKFTKEPLGTLKNPKEP